MNNLQKSVDGDQIAPSVGMKRRKRTKSSNRRCHSSQSAKAPSKKTQNSELDWQVPKLDQGKTTMGSRDGETKFKVQSQLLLWLRTEFRARWRRAVQIWTWLWNTHVNLSDCYCENIVFKMWLTNLFFKELVNQNL